MAVSPVPDLIYEDQQETRVSDIARLLDRPESVSADDALHRITVFVTYACNLACPYCKTITRSAAELDALPHKRAVYSLETLGRLLDPHTGTPIRHLHFTGGEATLLRDLPAMIREARRRGVERISLTSNGTASPDRYLALADAGLDELRISLDADDARLGRQLTLRSSAFAATVRALEALGRTSPRRFHLIVNTVVGLANRERLPALLRFVLAFGVDDVKLITEVDARGMLGEFPEAGRVRAEIAELLAAAPEGSYPLLRRKLATVFAADAIGLEDVAPVPDWRCYIPLTERTVDGVFYYPCSVYLRESGDPLGRIDEPQEEQRAKSAAFVRNGDCLRDPICRRFCLACTKAYNLRSNARRLA